MVIYAVKDYEDLSRRAANIIAAQIIMKPTAILGLATGSTPVSVYKRLVDKCQEGTVDFSRISTVNLDEYRGLSKEHSQSYRYFMDHNLFDHINVKKENTHLPDGLAEDVAAECRRYDCIIQDLGGIDLQLLGIGTNSHVGFNEPCDVFKTGTHLVELTQSTRESNARFFGSVDQVPTHALTMGIKGIMSARGILLLASGEAKAKALYESCFGPVNPKVPASILQLHNNATVIADEEALSCIRQKTGWEGESYSN